MKKLFGVMILSALPVACGSTIPSTPDASVPAGDDATVSALRSGRRAPEPSCVLTDAEPEISAIVLNVVSSGPGYATVRAKGLVAGSDPVGYCFQPTWSVVGGGKDTQLVIGRAADEVTLYASSGRYTLYASSGSAKAAIGLSIR